ncbi:MAG: hypothetical protein A3K09_08340 [Nitrospinae bacterium RIFCSPLOWO2_12_FULL_47_7]|nr:MAG: hypothetical protein A3K09_08340 [Nitrospinae bacterium RIFCSPLOWO2_12_FULL_47_7]
MPEEKDESAIVSPYIETGLHKITIAKRPLVRQEQSLALEPDSNNILFKFNLFMVSSYQKKPFCKCNSYFN